MVGATVGATVAAGSVTTGAVLICVGSLIGEINAPEGLPAPGSGRIPGAVGGGQGSG